MLKVPTMADRAWQCLVKYALEPAHEATFHPNSYGFRTGRSAHDAQKHLFHAQRGLKVKEAKTRLVNSTDGFDFLGWRFSVKSNGKFLCVPSEENYKAFKSKVKEVVNSSNYGAVVKAKKLAPIVRGWLNYHKFCDLSELSGKLWKLNHSTFRRFLKEKTLNRYHAEELVKKAFPRVGYKVNGHVKVKGDATPYNGDVTYWTKRNSALYDGATAKSLLKQGHRCGHCGLGFIDGERVHLHHIDGNHDNWNSKNLIALHESCHDYVHSSKQS